MRLLLVVDEKPGHFHQVDGLADIISDHVDVTLDRHGITLARYAKGALRRALADFGGPPSLWTKLLFGIDLSGIQRPDFVITSGVRTLSAGRFIARHFTAGLINCGLADSADRKHCTALLVPVVPCPREPNMVLCPTPTLVDPRKLPAPRRIRSAADLRGAKASLLLGGPSQFFRYAPPEWRLISQLVERAYSETGLLWTVFSSRRTPDAANRIFSDLAAAGICEFIDFEQTGPRPATELYSADIILVTEDSLSMFCEALASGRPVCSLRPRTAESSPEDEIFEEAVKGRRASRVSIADLSVREFIRQLLHIDASGEDYRARIWKAVEPVVLSAGGAPMRRGA